MLDPNATRFQEWNNLIRKGDFVGQNRPVGRVTFQDGLIGRAISPRPGPWRYLTTGLNPVSATELQVKSIRIDRSIGQDAANCNLEMPNVRQGQYSWLGVDEDPFGVGNYSIDRGAKPLTTSSIYGEPTSWEYNIIPFKQFLSPNIIVRTYQGYGSANFDADGYARLPGEAGYVHPHNDTKLVLTGVWLIDKVQFTGGVENPDISVEMRDMAKLLIEQPCYPPALPLARFPLVYKPVPKATHVPAGKRGKNVATYDTAAPVSHGMYDEQSTIAGHKGKHAFDGKSGTYWLSHSYTNPRSAYSFEWIQAKCKGNKINEVYVHTKKYGYVCYISVEENGDWKGSRTIPYSAAGHDHSHHAGINYVKKVSVGKSCKIRVRLARTYKASKVRLTFTNLKHFEEGPFFDYKVAVREIRAYYSTEGQPERTIPPNIKPGDISDWSLAIKELCGWAGFTWINAPTADSLLGTSTNGKGKLRVWGDFEKLGAGPIESTPGDYFLNKSFAECARQIADFIGALLYVDHTGGVQFRMPNVYSAGNFICDPDSVTMDARIKAHPIELHENVNLLSYSLVVDDAALRSEILVVGKEPDVLATNQVIAGGADLVGGGGAISFAAMLKNQLRPMALPADSTKGFATAAECQRMAELVAVKILFTLRRGSAKMYGHPGLHIDDQVRIFERVTNEVNIHYVSGIQSTMDLDTGEYLMDVTTNWLGRDPDTDWFMDRIALTPMIRQLPALYDRLEKSGAAGGDDPN